MSGNLDIIRVLDPAQIDPANYFTSLVEKATEKGLLSDEDVERMQIECLDILRDKTDHYNGRGSCSLRIETAQTIMDSVLYTIGLWLKTFAHPDDAVTALRTQTMQELYKRGRSRIDTMIAETKLLQRRICAQLVDIGPGYRAVIETDLAEFLEKYNAEYAAKETPGLLDYPVFNDLPESDGITFVKAFTEAFYCENQFCSLFDVDNVRRLLLAYSKDYDDIVINVYEPVLMTALGSIIVGEDFRLLSLASHDVEELELAFIAKSKEEIAQMLSDAAEELDQSLRLSDNVYRYVRCSLPIAAEKIADAVPDDAFTRIFRAPVQPQQTPEVRFSFGEKMPNSRYRDIVESVRLCDSSELKIEIIKGNVHSLADLNDLLLDAELNDAEIRDVLRLLNMGELAALHKRNAMLFSADPEDLREPELLLRDSVKNYISSMPDVWQNLIRMLEENMQEE